MRIVKVDWEDITSHSGWHHVSDNGLLLISSVGYLVAQSKDNILLAQSLSPENDRIAESLTIPRSVIRKTTTVGKVKLKDGVYV